RRQGRDVAFLRGADHPRRCGCRRGQAVSETMTAAQTPTRDDVPSTGGEPDSPGTSPAGPPRSARAAWLIKTLSRLAITVGAFVVVGLLYTAYKRFFAATGGTWPGTQTELPVAGD